MTCIGGLLDAVTGSVILTAGEVKEVEDHIDQLEAENAKLREEVEQWHRLTVGVKSSEYRTSQFQPCEHFEPKVVDE